MDEDNMYPNDSSFFFPREPKDQALGRKREKALTMEALPILKQSIERLNDQIEFYGKVTSIPDSVRSKPDEFLVIVNAHTLAVEILTSERNYLQDLVDQHAPK